MKRAWIGLLATAVFVFPLFSFSEDEQKPKTPASTATEHHEIVVTATRLETPARELGASVVVLTSGDLEKTKKTFVLEALRATCGVSIAQNGGPGASASIFLRGANSEHTLVLLDGIEINDPVNPSRSADLSQFDLTNIERLEIFRGPLSPLYGSDALGGLINLMSKRGSGRPRWTLAASGGSFQTLRGQAGVSGSTGPLDYSFGLSRYRTEGISAAGRRYSGNSESDGYDNLSLSARLGFKLGENIEAAFTARSIQTSTEIDNFGGPGGDDPNNVQDHDSIFLRGEVRGLFFADRWEQRLILAAVESRRDHKNPADPLHPFDSEEGFFKSRLLKLDWQNNLFLHPSDTLTFGLELEKERAESEYRSEGLWGPYESLFPKQSAGTAGIYAQNVLRLADRFFAVAGLRLDHHSRAGRALTFRLSPAVILPQTGTKIRASLGTGFKSPSLYQLYAPATFFGPIGNENLRPERSVGWEAGIEQPFLDGSFRAGITYFENAFRDLIDFDYSRGYLNIGKAGSNGVELEVEWTPGPDLLFSGSFTHLRAQDQISGSRLLRRPEDILTARLDYSFARRWTISFSLSGVGEREDLDYSSWTPQRVRLDPYLLLDGVLSYALRPGLHLYGRLDNIFDAEYETVYGYGTAGFSFQTGIRLDF